MSPSGEGSLHSILPALREDTCPCKEGATLLYFVFVAHVHFPWSSGALGVAVV